MHLVYIGLFTLLSIQEIQNLDIMMILVSKITAILCLLLTIFFGVQLKCGESIAPILSTRVTVEITNRLVDRYLAVQCKDKHNDFGVQQFNVGETFSFRFFPKYYYPSTLFFFVILYGWKEIIILIYMSKTKMDSVIKISVFGT